MNLRIICKMNLKMNYKISLKTKFQMKIMNNKRIYKVNKNNKLNKRKK